MPQRALRPCAARGCPILTRELYCSEHSHKADAYDKDRGSAAERGYDARWRAYRKWFIAQINCPTCGRNHTICEECAPKGLLRPAYAVDHIEPHRGDKELFARHSNQQSLCQSCHNAKSRCERLT